MLTFKVLSLLLRYPSEEIHAALREMPAVLEEEQLVPAPRRKALLALIGELQGMDVIAAQERYGELFDRGRKLSLHIFEHTHGESRDRGPAMVQLMNNYQECGFELAARELPDYVPLVLEFLAERPLEEATEMLGEAMPVLTLVAARLHERGSRYAAVLDALEAIAGAPDAADELRRKAAEEGPDEAIINMDKIWEEEAITFTHESALEGCGNNGAATTLEQPVQWDIGLRRTTTAPDSNR
ncbi:nitrate reductase molybdenum cofactor assembly chaperone [Thiohalomonas denitrificans]|uniref:nitrate reductase molybdenum cofactor assembly chaperone n=1 Tax=Thiohalomonas denitrificans TaxID=415747 RepID=UPI0026F0034F|nr:nitrate reductase molybdenum cofactor assembly chaperone [Thiohalomonas denitrificans]